MWAPPKKAEVFYYTIFPGVDVAANSSQGQTTQCSEKSKKTQVQRLRL